MKKIPVIFMLSWLFICTVAALSFLTPLYSGFTDSETITKKENESAAEEFTVVSSATNSENTVPAAAATGEILGKIKTEVISPYSAPLKYAKVYMKNSTDVKIDIKEELGKALSFTVKKTAEPEVLIYHTHTTECYMDEAREYYTKTDSTGTTDSNKNVVAVGEVLKTTLESAGIKVIHDSTVHDHPKFSGCYDRSAETVRAILKKYPTIKTVIDLHRDSINYNDGTKSKPTVKIEGKNAAQVMLVSGCGTGNVENFPNWRENLRYSLKIQNKLETMYPSLARPLSFCARRYNEHLTKGSILVEVGTEANTLSEAKYSAELLGKAIIEVLK